MNADEFKVNDKVWDMVYGWGVVFKMTKNAFPICVRFGIQDVYYTTEGNNNISRNRTLFFEEIKIPESAYKRPRWRAEKGNEYLLVSGIGDIYKTRDNYYEIDDLHFNVKNYFSSEEEAKESKFYKVFHEKE